MKNKTIFLLTIIAMVLFTSCGRENVNLSSGNIPLASAEEITNWENTNETLLGISAFDPAKGHLPVTGQPSGLLRDETFVAQDIDKQNVGGTLNRFHTYSEDNNSSDINLWMLIFDEYRPFYDMAEPSRDKDWFYPYTLVGSTLECDAKNYDVPYLLGEIAVAESFIDNNFFFRRADDTHCEEGIYLNKLDTFGMYGPIVLDEDHDDLPEVHPAQQFWFRNKTATTNQQQGFWLFFVQDVSDRFEDWIGSPLYGQYKIAFRYKPNAVKANMLGPITMEINLSLKEDMVTHEFPDQYTDCDNGRSHSLIIDGKRIVTVNESGYDDNDLGIQFVDVRKLNDGTIQGYVQVSMVIGDKKTKPLGMGILSLLIKDPVSTLVSDETSDLPIKENSKSKE